MNLGNIGFKAHCGECSYKCKEVKQKMKSEEFTRKDGSPGFNFKAEPKDIVTSRYDKPVKNDQGLYENFSLGVTTDDGSEIYLRLTKSQYEKLIAIGDLTDKKIEFYAYENKYGNQVGVRLLVE